MLITPWLFGCTTIIAGKKATSSGTVLLGHNEDISGRISTLFKVQQIRHKKTDKINLNVGGEVNQTGSTHSFLWSEVPLEKFSDFFLNGCGVIVTSNRTPSKEVDLALLKREGSIKDGGIDYWFRRIIAERAQTAKEGLEIAAWLIGEFGYAADGRIYCIADRNEAWLLQLVGGKHFCAERLADDEVTIVPNEFIVDKMEMHSPDFIFSRGIMEHAAKRSWYKADEDGNFLFKDTFAKEEINEYDFDFRQWIGYRLLGGEMPVHGNFPFSIRAKEPVTLSKLKQMLRNHYENTEFDLTKNSAGPHSSKIRSICSHNTVVSIIVEFREHNIEEMRAIMWTAPAKPCCSVYVPFCMGVSAIPPGFGMMDLSRSGMMSPVDATISHFNRDPSLLEDKQNIWWSFQALAEKTESHYTHISSTLNQYISDIEEQISINLQRLENKMAAQQHKNDFNIIRELDLFTEDTAQMVSSSLEALVKHPI